MDIKERFYANLNMIREDAEQTNDTPEFDPDKLSKKEKKNYMKNVPRWGERWDAKSKKPAKKRKRKTVDIPRWG